MSSRMRSGRRRPRATALLLLLSATGVLRAETRSEPSPPAHTERPPSASPASPAEAARERTPSPDDVSETPPARRAELARKRGHLGLAAYAEGRWRAALDHFDAAERWMHSPVFLLYAARCQHRLGSIDLARASYQQVITEEWDERAPAAWKEARVSARRELAALEPTAPEPAAPEPTAPEPAAAPVDESAPFAEPQGARKAAPTVAGLPPRSPKLRSVPGVDSPPHFAAAPEEVSPYRAGAYAAFGVGLAGLVAGTIAGGMAWSEAAEIRSRCEGSRCLASDETKAHDARRMAHVATTGFVVAATGAVAGLTLWLLPTPSERNVSVSLSPAQASLRARF